MRKVACINRSVLNKKYQTNHLIYKAKYKDIASDFLNIIFKEKEEVEKNENYKQIIPYVILHNNHDRIALYQRKGNETRLHGLWSAGFGGHIEDYEYKANHSIEELFYNSAIRELQEEFSNELGYDLKFEGVINEEHTKVGRTHIALVFTAKVNEVFFMPSAEIEAIKWVTIDESTSYQKELWSEMAIELLTKNKQLK